MLKRDWNNTVIEVLDLEHGQKVKAFWLKVCNDKNDVDWYEFNSFSKYYGHIDGEFCCYDRTDVNYNTTHILTLEQAEELLLNKQQPELTFPIEMYVSEHPITVDRCLLTMSVVAYIDGISHPWITDEFSWKYVEEISNITKEIKEPEIFEIDIDVAKEELATLHNCKPEQIKLIM